MADDLAILLERVDSAVMAHAEQHPETSTQGAIFALHAVASMWAQRARASAAGMTATHLRTVEPDFLKAVRLIAGIYEQPDPDAVVGAIVLARRPEAT